MLCKKLNKANFVIRIITENSRKTFNKVDAGKINKVIHKR